jgi:hypothetical protein
MNRNRYLIYGMMIFFLGGLLVGCHHRFDPMTKAEEIFVKKVDKTAGKLDLNDNQKAQLEKLKTDIRQNFQEGKKVRNEALAKIKEEGVKENPDIGKMTSFLQGALQDETTRINRAFDLLVGFQGNLNEAQKQKLGKMISKWVKKWD